MSFLKGFGVAILSLLLFLSLLIFGMAFTLNSTILNPDFIVSEIDRLDVSALVRESFAEEATGEEPQGEFQDAMIDTVTRLEPVVKEQLSAAIYPIYDYLLGERKARNWRLC